MMDTKDENLRTTKNIVLRDILHFCGVNIRNIILKISEINLQKIEEFRIRANKPLMVTVAGGDYFLNINGQFTSSFRQAYIVTTSDIYQTLELMSENSLYAYQEELKSGFLTLKGGHRVGIVGKVIMSGNIIKTVKDISSLNIRIAREIKGCADKIIPFVVNDISIYHTLIVSSPNCGKTTLLRDMIRQISSGIDYLDFKGRKVGLVDERSEIAACYKGVAQNDVGVRTDIFDSCPKPQGILMMVRSVSPHIIATDELGTKEDIDAMEEALNAGIKIITTAHAGDINELSKKPGIGKLFEKGLFERIIFLSKSNGVGTIEDIVDGHTLTSLWRCRNVS